MFEVGFTSTALWRDTLAADPRHDGYAEHRELLRNSYLTLRGNAEPLLAEAARSTPDFTVHDISHVDALWETASLVCGTTNSLTPAEAFVLGCAFVLHDAAMGVAAYGDGLPATVGEDKWRDMLSVAYFNSKGCWPEPEILDSPPADITEACYVQAIRETHAAQAARLVDQPWRTTAGNQFHLIQNTQLREAFGPLIGDLAASHWWEVDVLADRFKRTKGSLPRLPAEWTIEPLKLACILRLADATQIDSRRAPTFLLALRQPGGESFQHWRFQEHVSRPALFGDRVTYTSLRPFQQDAAEAWWLALDYLRGVDLELKKVDALLHDLGRTRLAARAVAGVDSPERFAELFPVQGWRPVDAALRISDVPGLVGTLGGQQLYGMEPEVAVRELIQNAQDAALARSAIDPDFTDARVDVRLIEQDGAWTLEVQDNGIGMDEDILVHGLLDFGRSGWNSGRVRNKFPGLAGGGFRPRGRFGIGFFSVFMLGNEVEVVTRRYDSAYADARVLRFNSLAKRPLLTAPKWPTRATPGTTVRVKLSTSPYAENGIFNHLNDDRMIELVQRLVLENSVPIHVRETTSPAVAVVPPFTLATGSPEDVFDRLYPPLTDSWLVGREKQRIQLREAFTQRATELFSEEHRRIGMAVLGPDLLYWSQLNYFGLISVNGFRADEFISFAGYLEGMPSRASRDNVDPVADRDEMSRWLATQESRLRDLGQFTDAMQLESGFTMLRARRGLAEDYAIGMVGNTVLRLGEVAQWAAEREEIFFATGFPLNVTTRPPQVSHYHTGVTVELPESWVMVYQFGFDELFTKLFPSQLNRDPAYEYARDHPTLTWQKYWWRLSGQVWGLFFKEVCRAWSCDIESLLAPLAERRWSDTDNLPDASMGTVFGLRLNRPQ